MMSRVRRRGTKGLSKFPIPGIGKDTFVLKHRGFSYLGIGRPVDQETTDIEKIICYSQFPRGGGIPCYRGCSGSTNLGQKAVL